MYSEQERQDSAIKIQACFKGYILRKKFKQLNDGMTYDLLINAIDIYNNVISQEKYMNTFLKKKKIRLSNFPSHISENIVKFAIYKKYGIMSCWDTEKGDLIIKILTFISQLEVKGSIDLYNGGPSSFGPTEEWDKIYFLDGVNTIEKKYKVYEVKLPNNCDKWKNIIISGKEFPVEDIPEIPNNINDLTLKELKDLCKKRGIISGGNKNVLIKRLKIEEPGTKVNKIETYEDQCLQKRRPRITFKELESQLGDDCELIFDGHISELNNLF